MSVPEKLLQIIIQEINMDSIESLSSDAESHDDADVIQLTDDAPHFDYKLERNIRIIWITAVAILIVLVIKLACDFANH